MKLNPSPSELKTLKTAMDAIETFTRKYQDAMHPEVLDSLCKSILELNDAIALMKAGY